MAVWPGAEHWGAGLGKGFGEGLETMARLKLGQVLDRHAQKEDEEEFIKAGFNPQASRFLSRQPRELQQRYIAQSGGGFANQQDPQAQQVEALQQLAYTPQEQESVAQQDVLSSINPRSQSNPTQRHLEQLTGGQGQNFLQSLLGGQGGQQQANSAQQSQNPLLAQAQQQQNIPAQTQAPRRITPAQALSAHQGSSLSRDIEQENINTEGRKALAEFSDKGKVARDIEKKLPNLEKLIKSGKLSSPTLAGVLGLPKKLGIDLTSWLSPETGELIGSENIFYPLMKYVIGGNPTDAKLKAFSDKLPKATDTDDVKLRKVENLKILVRDMVAEEKAANKVTKEFGGKLPQNFRELVYQEAGRKPSEEDSASKKEFSGLPSPESYKGNGFKDEETGRTAKVVNGQWKWV